MAEEKAMATVIEEKTIEEEEKMEKVVKLPFGLRLGKVEKEEAKTDEDEKVVKVKPKKMATWKKVGIGIGTAAAAIGLVGAGIALGGLDVTDEEIEDSDPDPSDEIIDVDPIAED